MRNVQLTAIFLMGLVPVVWGLLGFWGWVSLYKHRRITLEKNFALLTACHRRCIVEEDLDFHRKKCGAYLAMFLFVSIMIQLNYM